MAVSLSPLLVRILAHHDPDHQGSGIRGFLGETWVHQVSVTLHATGALLVAGGLAAVLLMRTLHRPEGAAPWSPGNHTWVRVAILGGWAVNLLGGSMRLFEPDHPSITAIGDNSWVQILVVKHVALLGAIFFSLLAIELWPRLWTKRLRQHAVIALVLVLFASISGGASTGFMLDTPGPMSEGEPAGDVGWGDQPVVSWHNTTVPFGGATPLSPRESSIPVSVPAAVTELWLTIEWENPAGEFWAVLYDARGDPQGTTHNTTDTQAELTIDDAIAGGTWELRVYSTFSLSDSVQTSIRITQGGHELRVLEETVSLTNGFEINLYMAPGAYFNYSWHIEEGEPVAWDIHSHPEGRVEIHEEGRDEHAEGAFVAGPDEVYSIYWRPDPGQMVTLTYHLEGNFTLHSIYR